MTKPFLEALEGRNRGRTPIWLMRQAGRYLPEYRKVRADARNFLDLCYSPDMATEVTLQPIRRFGFDAAILFADILLIPDALGQDVSFVEGEGPRLVPITDGKGLAQLDPTKIHDCLNPVYETVDRLSSALPPETALIGFAGAPWTVATYMVAGRGTPDQKDAKLWAYRDEAGFQALIDMLVEATVAYLDAQVKAGAEALQLFDSWSGTLPAQEFQKWCVEPTTQIVARLNALHPSIPIIGFPKGAGASYPVYAESTGINGVSLDTSTPLDWARTALPETIALQGNLDPIHLVAGGDKMRDAVDTILMKLKSERFIFNLGHGIIPETPPEHVADLVEYIRGWKP